MEAPHRNPFVLDLEAGHPGYSSTVVYATPADLAELARKLAETARSPAGRLAEYATRKHASSSRVTLEFRCADAQSIEQWHTPSRRGRWVGGAVVIGLIVLLGLALVGVRALVG
jgi:hypothetical protein